LRALALSGGVPLAEDEARAKQSHKGFLMKMVKKYFKDKFYFSLVEFGGG
jgi:hypothetical protein